jgi:hypothetical protein
MDNCSVHRKPEILATLREHNVKIIIFPPHTTQIFQALKLCLFGVFKRKVQSRLPFVNDSVTVGFIQKVFHALKQAFVPDNVRHLFIMLGLEFDGTQSPYTLLFREEKLRLRYANVSTDNRQTLIIDGRIPTKNLFESHISPASEVLR